MQYRLTKTFLSPDVQLPFEVVKGSSAERYKKSAELSKRFQRILDKNAGADEYCSINTIDKSLKETLKPYNIAVTYAQEYDKNAVAGLGHKIKGMTGIESIDILIEKFKLYFRSIEKSQKDITKATAVHEARHLFDELLNPKTSIFRYIGMENYNYKVRIKSFLGFVNYFQECMTGKDLKDMFKDAAKVLPKNAQVDMLQHARYLLMTEKNAYKDEYIYMLKHPRNNISNPFNILDKILLVHLDINNRLKTVTKLLAKVLKK